jgi:Tol biopolymer transport system component/DNA-binding winged helix-turn-helix (wHTH) protein
MSGENEAHTPMDDAWLEDGFWVGDWRVEPRLNRISKGSEECSIEPKMMDVLVCLAERPNRTVTKAQFMERVWGGTVVTDDVLSRGISELRRVLGDDARDPTYIETIRKTGYRLIAPVRPVASEERLPAEDAAPSSIAAVPDSVTKARRTRAVVEARTQAFTQQLRQRPRWQIVLLLTLALLVGGGAVGALWLWYATPDDAPPPQTVPFTSFPGEEFDPELSPDGSQLAFVWDGGQGANYDIYVKQSGADTPLRLTDHPAREHSPTWSPDGRRVAFVRSSNQHHSIHVTPVVGGSIREVARFGPREVQGLVWSPDGQRLAFAVQDEPYGAFGIHLIALESLRQRQLTVPAPHHRGDTTPRFSPDGQRIAFLRSVVDRIQDIYMVSIDGGIPRQLTRDRADISGLDWTTDGRGLVFASNRDGNFSLWRVPATGGTPRWIPMTGVGSDLHQPSIAQTGQMALTQRSMNTNVWWVRRTEDYNQFTSDRLIVSTQWDSNPAISPDGERVAFVSKRSGHFEVWTCQRDGSGMVQLTSFEGPLLSTPRWSPDGQRIVFVVRSGHRAGLYTMHSSGGESQRLTRHVAEDVAPSWSHDGKWIYFASNRTGAWQIWKVPSDSGLARIVTSDGGLAAFESADGRYLYYVKKNRPGIWRKPVGGEGESWLLNVMEPSDWGNWAVTAHGIYFVRRDAATPQLGYYSFASGRIFRVTALPDIPRHPSLTVAPGGEWFLYTRVDRSESDILLVEGDRRIE